MDVRLRNCQSVRILIGYRLPNNPSYALFFEEFCRLLQPVLSETSASLMITGNLTFHMENSNNAHTRQFFEILETFDLTLLDKHMWKCYEKPVNLTVKKHVNCSFSHVFSHVFHTFFTGCETIETLWTGHFSQGQNLCETQWKTLWVFNLWKNLRKTLWKTC